MPIAIRRPRRAAFFRGLGLAAALALAVALMPAVAEGEKDPLASLTWLSGDWAGDDAGVVNEERWTEPAGGMMLGVHRDVSGGRAIAFEFLRIQATADGIVYFASPGGNPATEFGMIENGGQRIVFENKQVEYPTRILYWLGKAGELHARIEGTPNGKPKFKEWVWKRRK